MHLRVLKMHHGLFLHVIHVAGTRMKHQGTDGLSRGALDAGVLSSTSMLTYFPLHLSALDQQPTLRNWVLSCYDLDAHWVAPFDWFNKGHQVGQHIWYPPPAAAEVALEQLAAANHKRPQT
jgi:hypothetical protein